MIRCKQNPCTSAHRRFQQLGDECLLNNQNRLFCCPREQLEKQLEMFLSVSVVSSSLNHLTPHCISISFGDFHSSDPWRIYPAKFTGINGPLVYFVKKEIVNGA